MGMLDMLGGLGNIENIGKQLSDFLNTSGERLDRIEQNQKLIMEKLGILTAEQQSAITAAVIYREEQKEGA